MMPVCRNATPPEALTDQSTKGDHAMQIQINTDDNIEGRDTLTAGLEAQLRDSLSRFADQITRVEVHLSDENAQKGASDDKRCLIEVRPSGQAPIAVTHSAGTVPESVTGAAQKMQRKLQSALGRQNNTKGGHSLRDLNPL
jgi:ribosome-associated translation inhibitor RaiA